MLFFYVKIKHSLRIHFMLPQFKCRYWNLNAFKCMHVYVRCVPEAACGVVENISLRRTLLNDTSISSSRQRHQHSLRQLRQTLSGQPLL